MAELAAAFDQAFDDGARTLLETIKTTFLEGWDDIRRLDPQHLEYLFDQMTELLGHAGQLASVHSQDQQEPEASGE